MSTDTPETSAVEAKSIKPTTVSAPENDLFSRIHTERNGNPDDHFAIVDSNQDGVMSRRELNAGINNDTLTPAQREYLGILGRNFPLVATIDTTDDASDKGISQRDETALRELYDSQVGTTRQMPSTFAKGLENFQLYDYDKNGGISQSDLTSLTSDANLTLTSEQLNVANNLGIALEGRQVELDRVNWAWSTPNAQLTREDLSTKQGETPSWDFDRLVRNREIQKYEGFTWRDAAGPISAVLLQSLVLPSSMGTVGLTVLSSSKAVKSWTADMKGQWSARDARQERNHLEYQGIRNVLSGLSRGDAVVSRDR